MKTKIYNLFTSLRLTVFLFLAIAVTSIFGTLIQQGLTPEKYKEIFDERVFLILNFLSIFDLYHSWWFTLLLFLLSINLIACTMKQIPRVVRLTFKARYKIDDSHFKSSQVIKILHSHNALSVLEQQAISFLRSISSFPTKIKRGDTYYFFAEKGRFSRLGIIIVHCSMIFILIGGLIGAVCGFNGQMNLIEGGKSDVVYLFGGKGTEKLGFEVLCEDFTISYYEMGIPKEYKTNITIVKRDAKVLDGVIRVNHPLTYDGFKFSQASFGIAGAYDFQINVIDKKTKKENILTLNLMKKIPIAGYNLSFAIAKFDPDYMGQGPAALGVLIRPGEEHDIFWMPKNFPIQKGGLVFNLNDFDTIYYSGIQVSKDPGLIFVWAGFILITFGFILILFFEHIRVFVRISKVTDGHEIYIGANTSKNKFAFRDKISVLILRFFEGEKS